MSKNILLYTFSALLSLAAFNSCKESEEVGEYDNWQARNEHFIDSISSVAKANADGSWMVIPAFTLSEDFGNDQDPKYYIYVKQLQKGSGTDRPFYNDSIRVHYSGRIIPTSAHPAGLNFDKSYSGSELDAATDVPSLFCPNQNVVGFATAVMNMVVGDRWKVYIPAYLGYGTQGKDKVPAHSALIFDIQLAKIYKYQVDTDTSWWVKKR